MVIEALKIMYIVQLLMCQVNGRTALHLAASAGHADVVEKLCSLMEVVKPPVTNGKNKNSRKVMEILAPKCQILADDVSITLLN